MSDSFNIAEQVELKPYNTMALPAVADYLVDVYDADGVLQALDFANQNKLAWCVIGGGSNVIFAPHFAGVVLHTKGTGISKISEDESSVILQVSAGHNWDEFLQYCIEHNYYGLENLAIIPGLVGAAPVQNIGAYGQELSACVHKVQVVDTQAQEVNYLNAEQCQFAYRDSIFKRQTGRFIITAVEFRLSKRFTPNIGYKPLAQALADIAEPTALQVREAVIAIRQSKLPDPKELPNSGSFFKNPVVDQNQLQQLQAQYPEIPHFEQADGSYKLAAGWLIEKLGFKGRAIGPVAMHDKQALVLVNKHGGTVMDVKALAMAVQDAVWQSFAVKLEQEPVVISSDPS